MFNLAQQSKYYYKNSDLIDSILYFLMLEVQKIQNSLRVHNN